MELRAYIDDSGLSDSPTSALAGWVGPSAHWAELAPRWAEALEWKPGVSAFKMAHAQAFKGEFAEWARETRDLRVKYLMTLIREQKLIGIGAVLRRADYDAIFKGKTAKSFDFPFQILLYSLVVLVVKAFAEHGLTSIEFVFDRQLGQEEHIRREWERLRKAAPAELRDILSTEPRFADDKVETGLQAADLYAWWVRRWASFYTDDAQPPDPPWGALDPPLNTENWVLRREHLKGMFEALTARSANGSARP